jgi:MoxR-like ATPase
MFASAGELDELLRRSGYIADPVTVTTVYPAAALHRPLLLEGPARSGKTQLAYAVAEAARTKVERLQCYEGSEEKAIGHFDESLQRLFVQHQAQAQTVDWNELAALLQGRRFFSAGPLLLALEYERPGVLLIDELDKVNPAFEMRDMLLPLVAKTEADRRKLLLRDGWASLVYDAQQYSGEREEP